MKKKKQDHKRNIDINEEKVAEEVLKITRRAFNRLAVGSIGAGLTLGPNGLLSGCGSDGDTKKEQNGSPFEHELKTLHFDLAHLPSVDTHTLVVAGKRYPLNKHTDDTLAKHMENNEGLTKYPIERITHFVEDIKLSTEKPHRVSVITDGQRGRGLALVHIHIPSKSRTNALKWAENKFQDRENKGGESYRDLPLAERDREVCAVEDQIHDDFVGAIQTAKSILQHHPEILNLDSDTAALVEQHMEHNAGVINLAESICQQGPAYEHDPTGEYLDGWAVLIPLKNDDGTPMVDSFGEQLFRYDLSEQTLVDVKPSLKQLLESVKNDPDLAGKQYQVFYEGDPPPEGDSSSNIDGGARESLIKSRDTSIKSSNSGYHHNVWFFDPDKTGDRSFSMSILNMNFIWYGVYAQYLDADNNPVDLVLDADSSLSGFAKDFALIEMGLQSYNTALKGICGPPATVFGLPIVPLPSSYDFELPEGASKIRVMLIGPGGFYFDAHLDSWEYLLIGIILTVIVQFAIPMYFIATTAGEDEDLSLMLVLKQKGVILKILTTIIPVVKEVFDPNVKNGKALAGSIVTLLEKLADTAINLLIKGSIEELALWMGSKVATEEAEEAIPFVGWAVKLVANLGAVLDMVTAAIEIAANPPVIDTTVSFTHPVEVTIKKDPENYGFPEVATHYEVSIFAGKKPITKTVELTMDDKGKDSLAVTVDAVPATGLRTKLEVHFFANTEWVAGQGTVIFLNKVPASGGAVTTEATIKQNPVPIGENTQFNHERKLSYSDKYEWVETTTPPALEELGSGLGGNKLTDMGNISVWVPGGMLGYSWRGQITSKCGGGAAGELYSFQNVNLRAGKESEGLQSPGCGFSGQTPVAYDTTAPGTKSDGHHFYLDPVDIRVDSPTYHLRKIYLDTTSSIQIDEDETWGVFTMPLDRMAVTKNGYVVGISTNHSKIGILRIPQAALSMADYDAGSPSAPRSLATGGKGQNNDGMVYLPAAITVTSDNNLLILNNGDVKNIKAFSVHGKPIKYFKNKTVSRIDLIPETGTQTLLDISVDPTGMIFVLSYTGQGDKSEDYHLDVYQNDGSHVMRNSGITVSRMVVDPFRSLYSLNYETIKGSGVIEPSVSVWIPSAPVLAPPLIRSIDEHLGRISHKPRRSLERFEY